MVKPPPSCPQRPKSSKNSFAIFFLKPETGHSLAKHCRTRESSADLLFLALIIQDHTDRNCHSEKDFGKYLYFYAHTGISAAQIAFAPPICPTKNGRRNRLPPRSMFLCSAARFLKKTEPLQRDAFSS